MRTAYMAISLVALVGLVPAAFAQGSPVVDPGKSAGTRTEAKRQMRTSGSNASVSLAVPTAKVSVGPTSLEGEPVYVRRTTVREGMTIVEVSTTPFEPVLPANQQVAQLAVRPDQPASW
jgi:hypothetical protein